MTWKWIRVSISLQRRTTLNRLVDEMRDTLKAVKSDGGEVATDEARTNDPVGMEVDAVEMDEKMGFARQSEASLLPLQKVTCSCLFATSTQLLLRWMTSWSFSSINKLSSWPNFEESP